MLGWLAPAFFCKKNCTCNQIFVIIDSPQNNLTKEDLIQVHLNHINKLLNLKGVKVKKFEVFDDKVSIYMDVSLKQGLCPSCGNNTSKIADYRSQVVKDLPIQMRNTYLVIRKKRFLCSCGKKFYPKLDFLPKYHRMTNRLSAYILQELRGAQSMKSVAQRANVSTHTVNRVFSYVQYSSPSFLNNPPEVLSIDEFRGNAGGHKFQCILVDPIQHKVLDILKDRKDTTLTTYFKEMKNRKNVKYFVTDMYSPYVRLARIFFTNAKIVIDRFHFVRQVMWAMEGVRKRIQKDLAPSLRKYFKKSRKLLLSKKDHLKEDSRQQLELMLLYKDDLRQAHYLKELFHEVLASKSKSEAKELLSRWIAYASSSGINEFEKCAATFTNWFAEILNAFEIPYSNGCIEGFNNKIKVMKRIAYGYRNFDNFRRKIMHCCS